MTFARRSLGNYATIAVCPKSKLRCNAGGRVPALTLFPTLSILSIFLPAPHSTLKSCSSLWQYLCPPSSVSLSALNYHSTTIQDVFHRLSTLPHQEDLCSPSDQLPIYPGPTQISFFAHHGVHHRTQPKHTPTTTHIQPSHSPTTALPHRPNPRDLPCAVSTFTSITHIAEERLPPGVKKTTR